MSLFNILPRALRPMFSHEADGPGLVGVYFDAATCQAAYDAAQIIGLEVHSLDLVKYGNSSFEVK